MGNMNNSDSFNYMKWTQVLSQYFTACCWELYCESRKRRTRLHVQDLWNVQLVGNISRLIVVANCSTSQWTQVQVQLDSVVQNDLQCSSCNNCLSLHMLQHSNIDICIIVWYYFLKRALLLILAIFQAADVIINYLHNFQKISHKKRDSIHY